ncbi:ABC transporter ATP-binding protein [Haloplanus rallus]|jgi:spermidine/putrescine transport system ATP-binding protein|uniref:Molybdate/tungstate import ATP-binding protein WtpC n=1 Tax=Haloplanus rallus TaxID=1816183 RepID=A0A6B9F514_9EURY|nr:MULTISPECIES: ABC transporter ATP-binding protein [Haloplanus]QGX95585.1 ABC transporter ATP-binding protein [Haloplanus rallus]
MTDGTVQETGRIQLEALRKEYGDLVAVEGVDLEIRAGEFLTLLGPSGCGKSTTLRMIAGLETPSDGDVFISGNRVTPLSANERDTSMVFQEWALFPHMTVKENVAFGLEMDGVPADERDRRIDDILELVELPDYHDRRATELSGGQKQRVAMARALVREPDVLLLDEPLASLDRKLRQHMEVELKKIQEELGITFLYVTHDQEEALTMSDRIAVMNDGRIEQVGEASEVYEHPETTFVANFLGETNLFEGTYEAGDGVGTIRTDGLDVTVESVDDADGRNAAAAVRPERVQLVDGGETLNTTNEWTGTVEDAIYKGSIQQYHVDVGPVELHVERQINETTRAFDEGAEVSVGFPATSGELIFE